METPWTTFNSPPAPVQPMAAGRVGTATWARVGLLGIAAAALLAVAILAFGSGAAPTGTLAAGNTSTATNNGPVIEDLSGFGGGPGFGPGGRGGFGHGFGGITITAISGSSISLETADGWTRTITVDSGTTYSRSGDTIALGDLAVGDEIGFRQTRENDGTFTIDSIVVIPPHAGGEVTAVSGSTITVSLPNDATVTINVDSDTKYDVNRDAATLADIKVGMFLVAEGTENSDGSLDATRGPCGRSRRGRQGLPWPRPRLRSGLRPGRSRQQARRLGGAERHRERDVVEHQRRTRAAAVGSRV